MVLIYGMLSAVHRGEGGRVRDPGKCEEQQEASMEQITGKALGLGDFSAGVWRMSLAWG